MPVKRVVTENGQFPSGADFVVNTAGQHRASEKIKESMFSALESGSTHHLLKKINWFTHKVLPKKAKLSSVRRVLSGCF